MSRWLAAAVAAVGILSGCTATETAMNDAPTDTPTRRDVAVIAHRGASASAPEHTFASWDLALEAGADFLEQDLQMTRDGKLVVLHDDTLDRTARGPADDCTGPVRERTLAQLRRCEVGSWFDPEFEGEPIPTLAEVLDRYADRARFYIETKSPEAAPGMEERLVELLRERELLDPERVFFQSFSAESLATLRGLAPEVPRTQLLASRHSGAEIRQRLEAIAAYADAIGPAHTRVDRSLMDAAHERGLLVHPYTVNEEPRMRALLDLEVDGIFTDRPGLLASLLAGDR